MTKKKKRNREVALVLSNPIALMKVEEMKSQLEVETKKRDLIVDFVKRHFVEGVDYGVIKITSKSGKEYSSKPTLFKPGAEKFCSMFRIRAEYAIDRETWEMLGNEKNTLAYICRLYNGDKLVGEGRGVCTVGEKNSANTAVKIAKKRSKLDAVLETGGLSDFFTQDLDDEETREAIVKTASGKSESKIDLAKQVNQAIETSRSIDNLLAIGQRIEVSEKLTAAQKEQLNKKLSEKLTQLETHADK